MNKYILNIRYNSIINTLYNISTIEIISPTPKHASILWLQTILVDIIIITITTIFSILLPYSYSLPTYSI